MTIAIENESVLYKNKIPEATVSADTVGDLINQMRGESNQNQAAENEASSENTANQSEKKSVIPKAVVSADDVKTEYIEKLISVLRDVDNGNNADLLASEPSNKKGYEHKMNQIPKINVCAPDTVGDLINQMRGESKQNQDAENGASSENTANQPEKKSVIPKAVVSADTVGDLINQMRGEDNQNQTAENEATAENTANQPEKKSVIPKAVVSADTVGDLINQMRGEDNQNQAAENEATAENTANQPEKKSVIPKAVVSADSELDKLRDLLTSGRDLEIDSGGRIVAVGSSNNHAVTENTNNQVKAKTIPKAVVSASQWYETNKDLYNAEVAAMRKEFNNPNLQPKFMNDGRMYWVVNTKPNLGRDENGREYNTMKYKLLLVYDADHPKVRYGSSVKVYPVSPSIDELQSYVNRLPGVTPKNVPHTLVDSTGARYLCTADTSNVSDDITRGITSAVTSYRFAVRWLTIFELGIRDPKTWAKFQRHGEI